MIGRSLETLETPPHLAIHSAMEAIKECTNKATLTAESADQPAGDRQELKGWLRWAGLALASRHLPELGSLRAAG